MYFTYIQVSSKLAALGLGGMNTTESGSGTAGPGEAVDQCSLDQPGVDGAVGSSSPGPVDPDFGDKLLALSARELGPALTLAAMLPAEVIASVPVQLTIHAPDDSEVYIEGWL